MLGKAATCFKKRTMTMHIKAISVMKKCKVVGGAVIIALLLYITVGPAPTVKQISNTKITPSHQQTKRVLSNETRVIDLIKAFKKVLQSKKPVSKVRVKPKGIPLGSSVKNVSNNLNYDYIIDGKDMCLASGGKEVFLLILVVSASTSVVERMTTRRTWGSTNEVGAMRVETKYLLGRSNANAVQRVVEAERKKFNDIIQTDFIDTYKNLTIKTITGLKWARTFCPNAKFILKTDHDAFVHVPNLIRYLKSFPLEKQKTLYAGELIGRFRYFVNASANG